ncbi:SDR family NAD(P)-dependent oxidoreductase [Streptomyces heilongjiangensis]|uniref:SDR family NAD(P)-dependent oxidoreductase n=1 Tax=Streptomyces heilongjiangensis TaxID=945052 RepID=A0ABW1AZV2_9ACTN|nr:SDR family NAD(P)-dependent oxidoreductase [Streptomyces heilongjiangensis]MDC2946494.1 SDR family NAD(P)-dependent oxidoreductase [Streptomyces heilongjiangensis]
MEMRGARILVPGATGRIGSALVERLHALGARPALAGRDPDTLARVSARSGHAPARTFEAWDLDACARTVDWAAAELGGLDGVVVCVGVAAFGPAPEVSDAVAEHLTAVNALAPMAFLRAAAPQVTEGGVLAAVTGVVAEAAPARMADYAAAKAALATWLTAVRREQRRRGVSVLEINLPHMDTGFAARAVRGEAPRLPRGLPVEEAVDAVVAALSDGARLVRPGTPGPLEVVR